MTDLQACKTLAHIFDYWAMGDDHSDQALQAILARAHALGREEGRKEKAREGRKRWRANNPEKHRQQRKDWIARNPEKQKAYVAKYFQEHKEELYEKRRLRNNMKSAKRKPVRAQAASGGGE